VVEMGPRSTLPTLLDHLSLGGNEGAGTGISLMTLHASKGLEFRAVFVAGLEEGLLPHRRSLEHEGEIQEERRLCYVGMTRARERLYLSYAHSRLFGGAPSLGQPSRFITEIGPGLLAVEMSTRRRARPRLSSVQLGDRVAHPRWREGVVTLVEGSGRETLVTVRFAGGEKRLQLCHAPLSRVENGDSDVLAV
jgi:DNA helicase-2/ATP-dependent DNA helicase PcrA